MQSVILAQSAILTKPIDLRQIAIRYINDYIGDAFTVGKLRLKQDQQKWWGANTISSEGSMSPYWRGAC